MSKERGLIMPIIQNFLKTLIPRRKNIKLIGEDYNGTKYYEDPEARRQRGRSFIPRDPENFEQEIPAEWEAWLRYRRQNPPTPEELQASINLIKLKQENAAELEIKYSEERGKPVEAVPAKPQTTFPAYHDYKDYGRDYKIKRDK